MVNNSPNSIHEKVRRLEQVLEEARLSNDLSDPNPYPSLHSIIEINNSYIHASQSALRWLNNYETILRELQDLLSKALALAESRRSNDLGTTKWDLLHIEFASILDQVVNLVNSQIDGDYIFAGSRLNVKPFSLDRNQNLVIYHGDDNEIVRYVRPRTTVKLNINGQTTFIGLIKVLIIGVNISTFPEIKLLRRKLQGTFNTINLVQSRNLTQQNLAYYALEQGKEMDCFLKDFQATTGANSIEYVILNLQEQASTYKTMLEVSTRALGVIDLFDMM
jgi:hypothetical protein